MAVGIFLDCRGVNTSGGTMNRGNEKKFIEVSEDAYKQNWVYRPWPEEKAVNNAAGRGKDDVDARPVDYKRAVSA